MTEDGLVINNMNIGYGGCVTNMRDTILKDLGIYNPKFIIGGKQSMTFCNKDYGQLYMNSIDIETK